MRAPAGRPRAGSSSRSAATADGSVSCWLPPCSNCLILDSKRGSSMRACRWLSGYALSELLLLLLSCEMLVTCDGRQRDRLMEAVILDIIPGVAFALTGCVACALTYATSLSLQGGPEPPRWLYKVLAVAMVATTTFTTWIGLAHVHVLGSGYTSLCACDIGISFCLLGQLLLALLWVFVALGSSSLSEWACWEGTCYARVWAEHNQFQGSASSFSWAGIGCGLFVLSLVMTRVQPLLGWDDGTDTYKWIPLAWAMVPTGTHFHIYTR